MPKESFVLVGHTTAFWFRRHLINEGEIRDHCELSDDVVEQINALLLS